ncbi:9789_t:CDS:1, partial [Entrophospora sp. SA101]
LIINLSTNKSNNSSAVQNDLNVNRNVAMKFESSKSCIVNRSTNAFNVPPITKLSALKHISDIS